MMSRIECDECEEKITPMIGETDMGVCAAATLPEGVCATDWRYAAVEPSSLHHQSDFEIFTWLKKCPVPLSLCAADKVLPISAEALAPLTTFDRSSGGGVDQAGPVVGGKRAHPEASKSAGLEPQRKGAVKRGGAEPIGALSNTLLELMCTYAVCLV